MKNLLIPFCLFCLIQSTFGQVEQQQGIIRPDKQIEPNPKEEEVGKDEREEPKMLMDSPFGDDDEQKEFGKGMDKEGKSDGKMDEGERSNRAKRQWGYGGYGYGGGWGGGWGRPWGGGWGGGWGRPWGGWGGGWGRGWGGGYGYGGYGGYWG